MSGDAEQEYFADGTSEESSRHCRSCGCFLSFAYKAKAVDVKRVARELNVRDQFLVSLDAAM